MGRQLRIEFPHALYHVDARGNNKQNIYRTDEDKELFLEVLSETIERYHWICHAYCLMDNHYHLLIETPNANLSLGMRQLNGVYSKRVNRRYSRCGHIFQGRYFSRLIEKDEHFLIVLRYIARNPVDACLVEDPLLWKYSSCADVAGGINNGHFLHEEFTLSLFSKDRQRARRLFCRFITDSEGSSAEYEIEPGEVFGSEEFKNKIKSMISGEDNLRDVYKRQLQIIRPSLEEIFRNVTDKEESTVT